MHISLVFETKKLKKGTTSMRQILWHKEDSSDLHDPNELSSGEKQLLATLSLVYVLNNYREYFICNNNSERTLNNYKPIVFLDEPDKYFDPLSIKKLLIQLQKSRIQLFMTTHRSDTVDILSNNEELKPTIYTISKKKTPVEIIPTNPVLSRLRLSKGVRSLSLNINFFVESTSDALFYTEFYDMLYRSKIGHIYMADSEKSKKRLISNRYRPIFMPVNHTKINHAEKEVDCGGGGVKNVLEITGRLLKHGEYIYRLRGETLCRATMPFGIIDADTQMYYYRTGTNMGYYSESMKELFTQAQTTDFAQHPNNIIVSRRYSLENISFDPIMLVSIFDEDALRSLFAESLKDHIIAVQSEYNSYINTQDTEKPTALQATLDTFFNAFILKSLVCKIVKRYADDIDDVIKKVKRKDARAAITEALTPLIDSLYSFKESELVDPPQDDFDQILTASIKSILVQIANSTTQIIRQILEKPPTNNTQLTDTEKDNFTNIQTKIEKLNESYQHDEKDLKNTARLQTNSIRRTSCPLSLSSKEYKLSIIEKYDTSNYPKDMSKDRRYHQSLLDRQCDAHKQRLDLTMYSRVNGYKIIEIKYPASFLFFKGDDFEACMNKDSLKTITKKLTEPGTCSKICLPHDTLMLFSSISNLMRDQANQVMRPERVETHDAAPGAIASM